MKDYEVVNTVTVSLNILYEDKRDARFAQHFLGHYITVTGDAAKDAKKLFNSEEWLKDLAWEWNALKIVPPMKDFFYGVIPSMVHRRLKYKSLLKKICEDGFFYIYHGYSLLCDGRGINMVFPDKKTGKYKKWGDKDREYWDSLSKKDREYVKSTFGIYVA